MWKRSADGMLRRLIGYQLERAGAQVERDRRAKQRVAKLGKRLRVSQGQLRSRSEERREPLLLLPLGTGRLAVPRQ